jgi:3-oxoacyl-[acyl-carrier protein] reductase
MHISLLNKNVIVTGASRGIGKAIAESLGACGARVAVHYNGSSEAARKVVSAIGNGSKAFRADMSKPLEVIQFFDDVVNEFDKIDVLVNNAAIALSSDPSKDDFSWLNEWISTVDINLNSVGLLCKKAIEHFVKNGDGRIINISSRAAFRGDTKDYLAYAASKAGVVALTRSIARAYGKNGIKAFNVAPGFVRTDMAQDFIDQYGEDYVRNDIALSELTEPKDIAPTIAFLASGLGDHATGCTIDINAGSYVH